MNNLAVLLGLALLIAVIAIGLLVVALVHVHNAGGRARVQLAQARRDATGSARERDRLGIHNERLLAEVERLRAGPRRLARPTASPLARQSAPADTVQFAAARAAVPNPSAPQIEGPRRAS